jgi:hypothetical protein
VRLNAFLGHGLCLSDQRSRFHSRENQLKLVAEGAVLLPWAGTEFFFIVAATGEVGGEAITGRVRERLARCEQLAQRGLTYSVSYRLLGPADRPANEPLGNYIGRVAVKLQEMVEEEISLKGEQK